MANGNNVNEGLMMAVRAAMVALVIAGTSLSIAVYERATGKAFVDVVSRNDIPDQFVEKDQTQ